MLSLVLSGYLFLLIFRPFEYWPIFGMLHLERVYMLIFMAIVFFSKDKRFISSPINGAVVCLTSTLVLAGIFGISWSNSWPFIVDYIKYVIFYFMIIISVRSEDDFRLIIFSFVVVMFLYVGKSAWEFFVHDRYIYRMGIKRMVGIDVTYGDPNSFAASICYSLPLTWALIRSHFEHPGVKLFLWSYGLLALVAIVFTGSRSGMVTFVFFLILLVMGASRKMLGIFVAGLILVISWDYMPEDLQSRFLSTFSSEYAATAGAVESAGGRMVGFMHGLEVWKQYPVFGVGPDNFSRTWPGLVSGPNAHNVYGQVMGELGTAGVCSFGLFLVVMYRVNSRVVVRCGQRKPKEESHAEPSKARFGVSGQTRHARPQAVAGRTVNTSLSKVVEKNTFLAVPSTQAVYVFVAQSITQTVLLMLFKGWADHNLYRYTWLWLAALTILCNHFSMQEAKIHEPV